MKYLLFWLSGFLPCRIINEKDRPYLERYYLCTLFNVRYYLHRFVGSDPDRGVHDHPWPWAVSVVLAGWYWDERRGIEQNDIARALAEFNGTTGLVRRRVRWFNWLTGDTFHRVVLPNILRRKWVDGRYVKNAAQPCWTLFFHSTVKSKAWGFLRPMEGHTSMFWVPHNYPLDGTSDTDKPGWWLTAPRGRDCEGRQA
jgi:hypothetical protein